MTSRLRDRRTLGRRTREAAAIVPWCGAMVLGTGWLLYVGPAGPSSYHAHHAFQFFRALHGTFRLCGSVGGAIACTDALVPPDVSHASDGVTERALLLYVDPDSALGRRIPRSPAAESVCADAWRDRGRELERLEIEEPRSSADAATLVERLVDAAGAGRTCLPAGKHPAVRKALRALPSMLGSNVRVGDLSAQTGLSTSRFSHVFNEQVGTSIRAYVRWLRLERAAHVLENGGTLTRAACAAGFADAAHLTRTFHGMFGIAPSEVTNVVRWMTSPSVPR